jgi:hypothetical protein
MTRRLTLSSLVLVLLPFAHADAAEAAAPVGPRVRVTAPDTDTPRLVGTLVGEDADSLRIDIGRRVVRLPRSAVTQLEFSQAPSRRGRGATIGFLSGAAAGLALGYAMGENPDDGREFCTFGGCATFGPFFPDKPTSALLAGGFFGLVGAGVGALVAHGERWEAQPEQRVKFSLAPAPGRGVAARVAIRFGRRR